VTEKARSAAAVPSKAVGGSSWQIRKDTTPRTECEETSVSEVIDATLPGKASKLQVITTVPKTDTGGWGDNLPRRLRELGLRNSAI